MVLRDPVSPHPLDDALTLAQQHVDERCDAVSYAELALVHEAWNRGKGLTAPNDVQTF